MCPFAPPLRRKVGRCGGRLCAGGGGGLQLFPPSFPPFLSQAVSRDCLCLCQQLGFSDQKPGPALPPASKHMPLKAASFSPGPGTSLLDICYRLWPCLGHDVEDPRKEILLPSAWFMWAARDGSGTNWEGFMVVSGTSSCRALPTLLLMALLAWALSECSPSFLSPH